VSRAEALLRGREALIAQCETQRAELALHVGALGTPIRIADRIANLMRYLRSHPVALGASAVLIGRPYLYGLAVGGSEGVAHVINILRRELEMAMASTGRPSIAAIDSSVIWR